MKCQKKMISKALHNFSQYGEQRVWGIIDRNGGIAKFRNWVDFLLSSNNRLSGISLNKILGDFDTSKVF